ncbi:hypothetical protein TNCV_1095691 [Trichonephila clavipes]|nr:hypothetical protein TNCV_1095691 [Trichonephila clavipes]
MTVGRPRTALGLTTITHGVIRLQSVEPVCAIIKEPIRGRRFATRENIANAVRQQVTRFTHGAANAETDGIQRLQHRWHRVVIAGDYIERL